MKRKITKALILAGGWGTRLRPLTYTIPKPLIPFCNIPILECIIQKLVKANIEEIILALNYFSEIIKKNCMEYEKKYNIRIIYSKEDVPLGTAGPLKLAEKYLEGNNFFVLNSDIYSNIDFVSFGAAFERCDSMGMIVTTNVDDPTRYGLIDVDNTFIKRFTEKPKQKIGEGPWRINAGMYAFTSEVLDYIELRDMSIENEVFPVLAENMKLKYYELEGYWMDIGQPMDYLRAQKEITKKEIPNEKNVVIGKNVRLGKDVELENCTIFDDSVVSDGVIIKDSIIGWGCCIETNCTINNSILGKNVIISENRNVCNEKISPNQISKAVFK